MAKSCQTTGIFVPRASLKLSNLVTMFQLTNPLLQLHSSASNGTFLSHKQQTFKEHESSCPFYFLFLVPISLEAFKLSQ